MPEVEDRTERIGSSMIYNICFEGGHSAWELLVLKIQVEENAPMKRGTWLEEPIMDRAASDHGWTYRKAPTVRKEINGVPYRNTCDFWAKAEKGEEFLCEVKSHGRWKIEDMYGVDYGSQVPDRVMVQCQMHCEFNDVPFCRVIAYFGGDAPRVFVVKRDRKFWARLQKKCEVFWNKYVLTGETPPLYLANCGEALNRVELESDELVTAEDEHIALDREIMDIAAQMKILKVRKEEASRRMRKLIGSDLGVRSGSFVWTLKPDKNKPKTDFEGVVRSLGGDIDPDVIEAHTSTKPSARKLRRKEIVNE